MHFFQSNIKIVFDINILKLELSLSAKNISLLKSASSGRQFTQCSSFELEPNKQRQIGQTEKKTKNECTKINPSQACKDEHHQDN